MSGQKFLYFAYGSNLLKQRLRLQNPTAVYKTTAKLKNYRLMFCSMHNPAESRWHGGIATIQHRAHSCVWGTVWELGVEDIPNLDRQESIYKAINVDVLTQDGTKLICRTYLLEPKDIPSCWDSRPSPQYMDVIIKGACQSNLPEDYINQLKNVEHNNYTGTVKVYEEVLQSLDR